jgi:predicted ester cyclase
MTTSQSGAYGAGDMLVDYILGITYEIWEEREIELINQYYGVDTVVFALDGITRGASAMIDGTRAMLESFPDRLLIADDVIWSGNHDDGFYSSHRIISPMTNKGPTIFGPATGKHVSIMSIADCVVETGVITREWLLRDNHALVVQLGYDPADAARIVASRRNEESCTWMESEIERLTGAGIPQQGGEQGDRTAPPSTSAAEFALQMIANNLAGGSDRLASSGYAPYAVLYRSPIELYSGRDAIGAHYAHLRNAIRVVGITIDHVAVQPADSQGIHIAVRWTAAGTHTGDYLGLPASDRPVYILGSTHWRVENNRVAREWTVFDGLGVLSQLV